ncbi:HAD-IIA family hydrolase [Paenibacillus eucommiae]|uniref:Acid sugar phosphatase n=1 Tax=Paenibacillus eucommiae TaxID=1355755 RepID=A0ABS4ITW7_9BACL|nr:HAD-IIA family hydrolase [Paenibacillus eucommiae]MBP1991028.1 phosphoglycolate/pyridoxal phosphate phosphatase family enzyme [Paenibacillus eucommiae]
MPDVLNFDGYFFDLDGTILLGDSLLPGVPETLAALRNQRKKILFLSNTTTRTRKECQTRLQKLGLESHLEEIVTAAYAAAVYLREGKLEGKPNVRDTRVFVIGEPAMLSELEEQGVEHTEDPLEATHVLVGMDMHFNYSKLHQAMKAVRNGAAMIAANPDPYCPVDGDLIPDTWAMVKAIEATSGKKPLAVIGKPSKYYGAKALESGGLPSDRCLMVGDRLETDILFGSVNGFSTALVLTGVTSEEDIGQSPVQPDFVWTSMEELLSMIQ